MTPTDPALIPGRKCANVDPEEFYPPRADISAARQVARHYCTGCPAIDVCLEWALAFEGSVGQTYRHGVYGGTTPAQRARIAKARAAA